MDFKAPVFQNKERLVWLSSDEIHHLSDRIAQHSLPPAFTTFVEKSRLDEANAKIAELEAEIAMIVKVENGG